MFMPLINCSFSRVGLFRLIWLDSEAIDHFYIIFQFAPLLICNIVGRILSHCTVSLIFHSAPQTTLNWFLTFLTLSHLIFA